MRCRSVHNSVKSMGLAEVQRSTSGVGCCKCVATAFEECQHERQRDREREREREPTNKNEMQTVIHDRVDSPALPHGKMCMRRRISVPPLLKLEA